MPIESNYIEQTATRRAALMALPVLDFIDYIVALTGVPLATIKELSTQEVFLARLGDYCTCGNYFPPLAYVASEYLANRPIAGPVLDDYATIDCFRIAAYCWYLPEDDPRGIPGRQDDWPKNIKGMMDPERKAYVAAGGDRDHLLILSKDVAPDHPLRSHLFLFDPKYRDEDNYVDYWYVRAHDKITPLLLDERFLAGLESVALGQCTFIGMVQNIYGEEESKPILDSQYPLFPGLEWDFTVRLVGKLAGQIRDGHRQVPPELREKYPEIYLLNTRDA
jgi:hypothetical protein